MEQADIPIAAAPRPLADPRDSAQYLDTERIKKDLKGHMIRGGAVTIVAEGIKQICWILATAVLARLLSPSDNGLIAMVVVVTGFMEIFKDLGLSAAVVQREQIDQRQSSTLFWINAGTGVALALLAIALAPLVSWFYEEPRLIMITIALSINFIFSGLMIQHRSLLRRQMRLTPLAIIDVASTAFETAVGIAAAFAGYGYWSLVIMQLIGSPFEVIATWMVCRWRPNRPAVAQGIRSMLAFGGNVTGYRMVNYFLRNIDNVLIGRVYGAQSLGLYSKAYNLLLLPINRVNGPISTAAIPALSRLADAPDRYRQAFADIAAKVCLLTMPLVAFMLSTSDWMVLVVLGPKWVEAGTIFAWLGISGLIEPITYVAVWLFLTQGRARQQLYWGLISGVLMVTAIVAGLPWGPVGVAASYGFMSLCIRLPLLFWYVGRQGPVSMRNLYAILAPFAYTVIAILLAVWVFRQFSGVQNPVIGLLIAGAITGVVTIATLAILPSGRPAIRDMKSIAMTLLKRGGVA